MKCAAVLKTADAQRSHPMYRRDPLRVFVLGSFRDLDPSLSGSRQLLERVVESLTSIGCDAFLSGDPRSIVLAGGSFPPRRMTEILEPRADLALYVATAMGRSDGWVSELTAMQIKNPAGSGKRVLLLESGYPLTSILDPLQQGYLCEPYVTIARWTNEVELCNMAKDFAFRTARGGGLPPAP